MGKFSDALDRFFAMPDEPGVVDLVVGAPIRVGAAIVSSGTIWVAGGENEHFDLRRAPRFGNPVEALRHYGRSLDPRPIAFTDLVEDGPSGVLFSSPITGPLDTCPDCSGRGHVVLFTSVDRCTACGGRGWVLPQFKLFEIFGDRFIPAEPDC